MISASKTNRARLWGSAAISSFNCLRATSRLHLGVAGEVDRTQTASIVKTDDLIPAIGANRRLSPRLGVVGPGFQQAPRRGAAQAAQALLNVRVINRLEHRPRRRAHIESRKALPRVAAVPRDMPVN